MPSARCECASGAVRPSTTPRILTIPETRYLKCAVLECL
jgi:hypothetical protein